MAECSESWRPAVCCAVIVAASCVGSSGCWARNGRRLAVERGGAPHLQTPPPSLRPPRPPLLTAPSLLGSSAPDRTPGPDPRLGPTGHRAQLTARRAIETSRHRQTMRDRPRSLSITIRCAHKTQHSSTLYVVPYIPYMTENVPNVPDTTPGNVCSQTIAQLCGPICSNFLICKSTNGSHPSESLLSFRERNVNSRSKPERSFSCYDIAEFIFFCFFFLNI